MQNKVKINAAVFKQLQTLDDLAHGINASGVFALLVIHMNGDNVSKVPVKLLILSGLNKQRALGISLNKNADPRLAVQKTLQVLVQNKLITPYNLPISSQEVCYRVSPDAAQM